MLLKAQCAAGGADIVNAYRQAIDGESFIDWRAASSFAAGLEQIEESLCELLKPGSAAILESSQAQFALGIESKQVERQLAHHAQICRRLTQVIGAGILAECHVQATMPSILDASMEPGCVQYRLRVRRHGANQATNVRAFFPAPRGSPRFSRCS